MLVEHDDDPREHEDGVRRGIMNALPISLALWLLIFVLVWTLHIF